MGDHLSVTMLLAWQVWATRRLKKSVNSPLEMISGDNILAVLVEARIQFNS